MKNRIIAIGSLLFFSCFWIGCGNAFPPDLSGDSDQMCAGALINANDKSDKTELDSAILWCLYIKHPHKTNHKQWYQM